MAMYADSLDKTACNVLITTVSFQETGIALQLLPALCLVSVLYLAKVKPEPTCDLENTQSILPLKENDVWTKCNHADTVP